MPNPTSNDVHLDVPLTNISVAHMQSLEGFVANKVFPIVPVNKQSDRYYIFDRADWNRNDMKKRAPGTESAGAGYRLSDDSYLCEVFALHRNVDNQTAANSDAQFDLDAEAAEFLSLKAMINREISFQETYFKTGVWSEDLDVTADVTFGNVAFTAAASTPIKGIRAAIRRQQLLTGIKPNSLVIAGKTWDAIVDNEDFLSRVIGGANNDRPAAVNMQLMAQMLGIDNVEVADGLVNTAQETAAGAETNQFICDEGMLLYYKPRRASLRTPSAGYTFAWTGLTGNAVEGTGVYTIDAPLIRSKRIEIEDSFAHKVVSAEMGTFIHQTI